MSTTLFGIAVDRALGSLMRVVVTRPERLATAKAAADKVIAAIDEAARTVVVPQGVEIDLGATAKALAADLAAAAAREAIGEGGVLVSLGGDIAVAGEPPPEGWAVQTSEDSNARIEEDEETITIQS